MGLSAKRRSILVLALALAALAPRRALAQQEDRRYLAAPTDGVALPATPLAGEHDARALVSNPGGLALVRGSELLFALQLEDPELANAPGTGGGLFWAAPAGGGLLPRLGLGLGLEVLRPSREALKSDLGTPVRASLGAALSLSRSLAIGVAWRHFFDDERLDGLDTFDLGASGRWGDHLALGLTLRDALAPRALGEIVHRRYQAELAVRPLGSDALELGTSVRLEEESGDVDVLGRATLRVARGVYAHLGVESRRLEIESTAGAQVTDERGRDVRASLGFELSLGRFGVTTWASALRDERGSSHPLGAGLLVRSSQVEVPSVLGPEPHIERIELSGELSGAALVELVLRLRAIGRDRSAVAVALVVGDLSAGWAALREVRDELAALRASGRKVYAYLVNASTRDYYLASVADKVYFDPAGALELTGVASTTLFLRGALDLVGVSAQVEKIAEYKSAPEQVTRHGPSEPARAMRAELLDGVWAELVAAISQSRRLSQARVRELIDGGPYSAGQLAASAELVDGVATPERAALAIAKDLGLDVGVAVPPLERPTRWRRRAIAVIHVHGDIVEGKSQVVPLLGRRTAGSESILAALAAARAAPSVGAIVLRIDSPGGSALASEFIAREVFATRGHKPILCSLGNVAASGGYFVAAGCDLIFAEPTTVTGSIGIFFGKPDLSGLWAKLGVHAHTELRGRRADLGSTNRPYTEEERALLREQLRYGYGRFVGAVAEGRGLSRAQVDEVGRGQVWTGARAKELGLVDRLGSVADAVEEAKRRMGAAPSERLEVVQLPRVDQGLWSYLGRVTGAASAEREAATALVTSQLAAVLEDVFPSLWLSPGTAQARLPFDWR